MTVFGTMALSLRGLIQLGSSPLIAVATTDYSAAALVSAGMPSDGVARERPSACGPQEHGHLDLFSSGMSVREVGVAVTREIHPGVDRVDIVAAPDSEKIC